MAESKILFLGTGTGGAANQQLRSSGGIVIQTHGYQFFLDPGPGALLRAKQFGINARLNTAILVSHAHLNHCNDANILISSMTHDGIDPKGVLISNKTFVSGSESINPVLTKFHQKCVERIITPDPGQKIGIENVEIHALKTQHSDSSAIGFKFFTKDFILTYSSDTAYSREIVEQYQQSDILILNMPNFDKKSDSNLNVEDVKKIIRKVQPRLVLLTHFGLKVIHKDPLLIARSIHRETGIQTIAAKDGLLIAPQSYSAELRQKTLNLYPSEKAKELKEESEELRIQPHNPESETASQGNNDLSFL